MTCLTEKIEQFEQSLKRLEEVLNIEKNDVSRDAGIQRFEFSFELFWKVIKIYLRDVEKIECYSPKSCFREFKNIFSLSNDDLEFCLKMADDRNLSLHIYSEEMAEKIYNSLPDYLKMMRKIFNKIKV